MPEWMKCFMCGEHADQWHREPALLLLTCSCGVRYSEHLIALYRDPSFMGHSSEEWNRIRDRDGYEVWRDGDSVIIQEAAHAS